MKMIKSLMPLALAGAVISNGAIAEEAEAPAAESAIDYSMTVSNMYLWRGVDLGNSGAISGDVSYSNSGFHTGLWVSSGDFSNEYDLWAGYGGEAGDFTYDLSLWTYVYPDGNVNNAAGTDEMNDPGKLSEVVLTVGYSNFSMSYYDNVAGNAGYRYFTLSGQFDKWGVTLGNVDEGRPAPADSNYTHADVSYSYTDNLTFTVSQVIDREDNVTVPNRAKFQISYNLPL